MGAADRTLMETPGADARIGQNRNMLDESTRGDIVDGMHELSWTITQRQRLRPSANGTSVCQCMNLSVDSAKLRSTEQPLQI